MKFTVCSVSKHVSIIDIDSVYLLAAEAERHTFFLHKYKPRGLVYQPIIYTSGAVMQYEYEA